MPAWYNLLLCCLGTLITLRAKKNALIAAFWTRIVNILGDEQLRNIQSWIPKFNTFQSSLKERPITCTLIYVKVYTNDTLVAAGDSPRLRFLLHFTRCEAAALFNIVLQHYPAADPDLIELHITGRDLHSSGHILKLRKTESGFEYYVTTSRVMSHTPVTPYYEPALFGQIDLNPFPPAQERPSEGPTDSGTTLEELEALMDGS